MNDCLQLKKSNCKNCYKCIRNCPVKSIRFSDNQAHIVKDECILCGMCFVGCPQNAKQIRNDIDVAKSLIATNKPVYASIAPAYAANYRGVNINAMKKALKKLGFADAEETAIGATIVKKQYENIIKERKQNIVISSCCHSVNTLIQKYYPEVLSYLAKVVSPMQAHCAKIKREHPDSYTVFIGPCISKKDEGDRCSSLIDCVLTFEELTDWFESENIKFEDTPDINTKGRARLFPTAGGIIRSMDLEPDFNYIAIDGMENCINAINDIKNGTIENCFIEMSACTGSCIGGPVMNREHHYPVSDLLAVNKTSSKSDFCVNMPEVQELTKEFPYEGLSKQMPGSSAIEEILIKMGKHNKEQELNCGSCGYSTCRDKAVAVFMGKADLTMCLPFLKEKAESFSDKIINNTPNGIIVFNEKLEIQQINSAACKILSVTANDIINNSIDDILEPSDYLIVMDNGLNVYENRKYLERYKKFIEETIIYDKEYHIIMTIMKDITDEETLRLSKQKQSNQAIEITDKVIEKQMRVVQEIASLLGETTAETKMALSKLKETLRDE